MGYYRHMKTTQERRRWFADEELVREHRELHIRRKRSFRSLPSYYEDIPKSAWQDRSWKRHRDTQWGVNRSNHSKSNGKRGTFDTPMVEMSCYPFRIMGMRLFRNCYGGTVDKFPFRVRFKYIKNKTA